MSVHCVNPKHSSVKELAKELNINPVAAAAKIALWQDSNGLDKWPTKEDFQEKENFVIGSNLGDIEKNTKAILVRELGSRKQSEFIDYLVSQTLEALEGNPSVNLRDVSTKIFEELRTDLEKAESNLEDYGTLTPEELEEFKEDLIRDTQIVKNNKILLNNQSVLTNQAFYAFNKVKVYKTELIGEELQDGEDEREGKDNWGKHSALEDMKDKIRPEMKRLLSRIHDYHKNGTVKRNFLGRPKFQTWEAVYKDLQSMLTNHVPDFDRMMDTLAGYTFAKPYLNEVIEKLQKSEQAKKNQFVEIMASHNNEMSLIMYDIGYDGSTRYIVQKSNLNDVQTIIRSKWVNNFNASSLQTRNLNGDAVYDQGELAKVLTAFDKIETAKDLQAWYKSVGVTISDATTDAIENGLYKEKGRKQTVKSMISKFGAAKYIQEDLLRLQKLPLTNENNHLKNTSLRNLAEFEARYTPTIISASTRTAGKQVSTYNSNKFITNNFIDILDLTNQGDEIYTSKVLTEKAKDGFSSNSYILRNIVEYNEDGTPKYHNGEVVVNPDNPFLANFRYWTSDLEGIKEVGTVARNRREMSQLPEVEVERSLIGRLQTKIMSRTTAKFEGRIGQTMYLTTSDKPTVMGLQMILPKITYESNGLPSEETYELLYDQLITSEINRMKVYRKNKEMGKVYNDDHYEAGANIFFFIPELNDIPELFSSDGMVNPDIDSYRELMMGALHDHVETLIKNKKEFWNKYKIGQKIMGMFGPKFTDFSLDKDFIADLGTTDYLTAAATHMVATYLISNVNTAMIFTTDIANYYDTKFKGTKLERIRETFTNLGKRLAADAGPKSTNQNTMNTKTVQAMVNDRIVSSENLTEYLKKLDGISKEDLSKLSKDEIKKLKSAPYIGFKGTDAQELVTTVERLRMLNDRGLIPTELFNAAYKIINREIGARNHYYNDIVVKELNTINPSYGRIYENTILTPFKPLYCYNVFDENLGRTKRVFIKSSDYPLNDKYTQGMEIDDLRKAMEAQGIDRLAFKTAVKVGAPTTETNLWGSNNKMKLSPTEDILDQYSDLKDNPIENAEAIKALEDKYILFHAGNTSLLPRRGLGIQVETPFDPLKEHINRVTQAHKNLFTDIRDVEGFEYHGKTYKGADLEQLYNDKFNDLFKKHRNSLYTDLGMEKDGSIKDDKVFVQKIKDVIKKEMISRNYPLSDQEFLDLEDSLNLIPFLPSSEKIEALLNSIVRNRILKMKFPGYSGILGSEEGYHWKTTEQFDEHQTGIYLTPSFQGSLKSNQIIIPWKWTDGKGNSLDIKQFVDEKTKRINIPKELLEMFAMRIPNSSKSLQANIEVVGFIDAPTDLVIATRDFIAKMGSDFDVDKIYIYKTETDFKNGKLSRKESLENDIIDVMKAVHNNEAIYDLVNTPLSMWELEDIAKDIYEIKQKTFFSGMSQEYQSKKFVQANAAKSAVGVYASLSILHAVAQGKEVTVVDSEGEPIRVRFDRKLSKGELGNKYSIDEDGLRISQVIEALLSASVDNEKLQILDKLNMNSETFGVVSLLTTLGFSKEIFYFITQSTIIDALDRFASSKAQGGFDSMGIIASKIRLEYEKLDPSLKNMKNDVLDNMADSLTTEELSKMLKEGKDFKDYYKLQLGLLNKFIFLQQQAKNLIQLNQLLGVDSQGFGKSILESNEYMAALPDLLQGNLQNVDRMFGEFDEKYNFIKPTTIPGQAIFYGLKTNHDIWNRFFPYERDGFRLVRKYVRDNSRIMDSISSRYEAARETWDQMKSYLFTRNDLGFLNHESLDEFKQRAFFGTNSLARIVQRLQDHIDNDFINALEVKIEGNLPSSVTYRAAVKEDENESRLYSSFLDLLMNPISLGKDGEPLMINGEEYTSRHLYHDLVTAFYVAGGIQKANQYGKYISPSYLYSLPFNKLITSADTFSYTGLGIHPELRKSQFYIPQVALQILQHHPEQIDNKVFKDDMIKTNTGFKGKQFFEQAKDIPLMATSFNKEASIGKHRWVPYILTSFEPSSLTVGENTIEGYVGIYTQINALGTKDFTEFNSNIDIDRTAVSTLAQNPFSVYMNFPIDHKGMEFTNPLQAATKFTDLGVKETTTPQDSKTIIDEVLARISNSTNMYNNQLARYYRNLDFKISQIKIDNNPYRAGSILKDVLTFSNIELTRDKVESTFLHELTHRLQTQAIDDPKNKAIVARLDKIRADLKTSIEKGDHPHLLTDYLILRKYLLTTYNLRGKGNKAANNAELEKISKQLKTNDPENVIEYVDSQKERFSKIKPIMYGLTDIDEFAEAVIQDEGFQKFLNEIPSRNPKHRTLLGQVLDSIVEMIKNITGIKPGSVLEDVIMDVVKLTNINPENYTARDITQEGEDINLGDIIPTQEDIFKKFNELNPDGTKKRLLSTNKGDNSNYKAMQQRAIKINQGQKFYQASVIKVAVNNKEFFTISLEMRKEMHTFEGRYNAISDETVEKYLKNCI
jgi:hypothetical protein